MFSCCEAALTVGWEASLAEVVAVQASDTILAGGCLRKHEGICDAFAVTVAVASFCCCDCSFGHALPQDVGVQARDNDDSEERAALPEDLWLMAWTFYRAPRSL
eukprot:3078429-Amphidinium_carterae.1